MTVSLDQPLGPSDASRGLRAFLKGCSMKRFLLLLVLLLTGAPAWAQVIGNIDGVVLSGTQYRINGWACDTGVTASIDVHVYVGGPAGTGTGIAIVTASNASEAAVATRCQTSGTAYRFSIPISDSIRTQHSNKKIYIHGISQSGGSNLTINNSGVFLIPPPLSQTRSYVYNAAQELCKTIEPETGATVMHYDGAGNLDWSAAGLNLTSTTSCQDTDASIAARKVTRTYDARNRLKTLNFPDTKGNQTWTYFPDGLPASIAVTNPNVANPTLTSYAYNRRRLLTGESLNHLGGTTVWGAGYGYDANGALKIQTYPSGLSIDYAPNALGQPTQAGTYATGVSYYPNGAIAQFTYGNGIKHTLTQNVRQLPDRSLDDYGTSKFLDDSYDYDQNGNVAAISDGLTGNRGNRTMTYDELDRLTKVDSPMYGTDAVNHVALYGYDGLDNLTGVVIGGTKARLLSYCYDANWRLANVKNNFNGEGCAGSTVIGLGYDVQGNLANKNGQAFEFDYGNRLRNVPGKEWYAYDGQGRRVLSCTSAACSYQMYSQMGQLLTSYDYRNNKRVESIYLGGSLVALRELDTTTSTTTTKYQHTDALGSPVAETNQSRAILEKSEYEPFGQVLNRPLEDGPGYTGHTLDASTGLNYMQQRYYDPTIGRFLSIDPVTADEDTGDNFNRYWYANNNPYKFTDPDGREAEENQQLPPPPPPPQQQQIATLTTVTVTAPRAPPISSPTSSPVGWQALLAELGAFLKTSPIVISLTLSGDTPCGGSGGRPCVYQAEEHTKNARPSTKNKHQKGRARAKTDKHGGEKGDGRRSPYGKRPPNHRGPWPPKD